MELVVVGGVDDRGDRFGGHDVDQPAEEAGSSDPSGQRSEHLVTLRDEPPGPDRGVRRGDQLVGVVSDGGGVVS